MHHFHTKFALTKALPLADHKLKIGQPRKVIKKHKKKFTETYSSQNLKKPALKRQEKFDNTLARLLL
jgi:hypothetical protein